MAEIQIVPYATNKYNAKRSLYKGTNYHSKMEAGYAQELDLRLKAKDIDAWDRQYKVSFDANGVHICNYYVDFRIFHTDGTIELVECKGFVTEAFRIKRQLMYAYYLPAHPATIYTIIPYKPSYNYLRSMQRKK